MAIDPKVLDDLARRLADAVPEGVRSVQRDLEANFRAVLQAALGKLDLVTREEFDVQSQVLGRTREKLESIAARLEELEASLKATKKPPAG
jgi:BMFP domain-containing protein YqiC